jgi:rod shape-determining protein MreC
MKGRAFALLAFVLLVCLVMLTVQSRGGFPRAGEYAARVATPVQTALARIHRAAFGVWATYLDWKNVRAENARLREEIQRLRVDGLVVGETLEENRRLRQLLTLRDRLPLATMPGEVIARESNGWVRSLTVNRGREDHVGRLTAVISPAGLIGRVVDVRPGASIVQVLTDPASTVGAHVVRTRTPGIVEGEARGALRFKYMARDGNAIEVGDLIVTSGHGGLFPRGIPVGRVRSIDDRGSALFHFAVLAPLVDFARVDEVLLLTGETTQDLAAHFPTDD